MAESNLAAYAAQLINNLPCVGGKQAKPYDNFLTTSAGHNVATAKFEPGTMIEVVNDGTYGPRGVSQLVYGKLVKQDTSVSVAAGALLVPESPASGVIDPWNFSADGDDVGDIAMGQAVVAISAMTEGYYGWFWCGGVAPASVIPAFQTATIKTDTNIAAGDNLTVVATSEADEDYLILKPLTYSLDGDAQTLVPVRSMGMALMADA